MRLSGEPPGGREPAEQEGMSRGLALSAALHVAVAVLLVFGLPDLFRPAPLENQPVAVDLVTIGPKTLATHPNPYVPRPQAKPDIPLADVPAARPLPKPVPPKPAPRPSTAAGAPPPPPPKVKIAKAKWQPPPRPEPKPAPPRPRPVIAAAVPRPPQKPRPPLRMAQAQTRLLRQQKAYDPGDFQRLLRNLAPEHNAPSPDKPPQVRQLLSAAASSQPKAPLGAQLTASEIDLIRQQIERCWNIPEGARDDKDLVVEMRVSVDRDGDVRRATILDSGSTVSDPVFRAAADSAKRALFNPQCRPLRLPPDKYEYWKEFIMDFSPRDIL
jgi:outer membrane biosynthesis protein TonB